MTGRLSGCQKPGCLSWWLAGCVYISVISPADNARQEISRPGGPVRSACRMGYAAKIGLSGCPSGRLLAVFRFVGAWLNA